MVEEVAMVRCLCVQYEQIISKVKKTLVLPS